jgi:NADP-dependent 3-hydroxy acid dehydrogenase YdfG
VTYKSALIVGAGSGLSASLARAFATAGMSVALAARSAAKLDEFVKETGAKAYNCDAANATKSRSCSPISTPRR